MVLARTNLPQLCCPFASLLQWTRSSSISADNPPLRPSHFHTPPTIDRFSGEPPLSPPVWLRMKTIHDRDLGGFTELEPLPSGLQRELMPRHVAVIIDGNARWARRRGLPASSGHAAGVQSLRELVQLSAKWGIRVLTVFAFSSENWFRPQTEIDFLMGLFERVAESELQNLSREGVRITIMGDSSKLPNSLQNLLSHAERYTKDNSRLHLVVAISYSGKSDIAQACKSIAHKVKDGVICLEDIDEELLRGN